MRVLGMPLWPEKLSDKQYIERVRKGLRMRRRWRYILALIGLCILVMVILCCVLAIKFLADANNMIRLTGHSAPTVSEQAVYSVFFLAIVMGSYLGFMFFNAIMHIGSAFLEYRKDRLLVECWDSLSDAEKSRLRQKSS
jgi:hypothetical protein